MLDPIIGAQLGGKEKEAAAQHDQGNLEG